MESQNKMIKNSRAQSEIELIIVIGLIIFGIIQFNQFILNFVRKEGVRFERVNTKTYKQIFN